MNTSTLSPSAVTHCPYFSYVFFAIHVPQARLNPSRRHGEGPRRPLPEMMSLKTFMVDGCDAMNTERRGGTGRPVWRRARKDHRPVNKQGSHGLRTDPLHTITLLLPYMACSPVQILRINKSHCYLICT